MRPVEGRRGIGYELGGSKERCAEICSKTKGLA